MSESDAQSFISDETESVFEDSKRDFLNLEKEDMNNVENKNNEIEETEEEHQGVISLENTIEKIIDKKLGNLLENQISRKRKSESKTIR